VHVGLDLGLIEIDWVLNVELESSEERDPDSSVTEAVIARGNDGHHLG